MPLKKDPDLQNIHSHKKERKEKKTLPYIYLKKTCKCGNQMIVRTENATVDLKQLKKKKFSYHRQYTSTYRLSWTKNVHDQLLPTY